jgi:hypothetical protein
MTDATAVAVSISWAKGHGDIVFFRLISKKGFS